MGFMRWRGVEELLSIVGTAADQPNLGQPPAASNFGAS